MKDFETARKEIKAFAFDVDGVLSDTVMPLHPSGEPMRTVSTKDGYALQYAVKRGYPIAIITGGSTQAIRKRYEGLGITHIYMGIKNKEGIFRDFAKKEGIDIADIAYMGDDIPDIGILKICGTPCCPHDAAEDVRRLCSFVAKAEGGRGCVRELLEAVLKAQNKWMDDAEAFGW